MNAVGVESTSRPAPAPTQRPAWRSVAVPTEHGGWGLTAEPIVLGLLLAPSTAGALIGVAGVLAFLCRTPLKVALVDRARHRRLPRTRLAERIAVVEMSAIAVLGAGAWAVAGPTFLVPLAVAAPLVGLELWFDMRSRSRRLVPELAGAAGICALSAAIVVAGGGSWQLAAGAWLILAARSTAAIPFVRRCVAVLHARPTVGPRQVVWDLTAVAAAIGAVALDRSLVAGAVAVVFVAVVQRATVAGGPPRAVVIGAQQSAFGALVVLATWLGVVVA